MVSPSPLLELDVAVCYGPHDIRIERELVEPTGSAEVLVRVEYCGVCPWDLRVFSGLSSSVSYPLQLGHEISGTVERVGDAVRGLRPGDHVVVDASRRCGECAPCRRGMENLCEKPDYSRGGFARFITAPASDAVPLRDNTSLVAATFTEPLACIVRAHNRAAAGEGDTALVLGCGPLGLLHAQLLKHRGVRVLASDPIAQRLEVARSLGVDLALNPTEVDVPEVVATETDGWGVDVAIVATSAIAAAREALPLLACGGRLVLFGGIYPEATLELDPNEVHYRETWITGASDYTRAEFLQALRLIEDGVLEIEPLVSDIYPLRDIARAIVSLKTGNNLKVVVRCNGESKPESDGE